MSRMHLVASSGAELLADVDEVAKVPPFDEFHREEMLPVRLADFVNGDDVFVLEPFAQFGFAVKLGDRLGVFRPALPQHLQPHHFSRPQVAAPGTRGRSSPRRCDTSACTSPAPGRRFPLSRSAPPGRKSEAPCARATSGRRRSGSSSCPTAPDRCRSDAAEPGADAPASGRARRPSLMPCSVCRS